MVRAGLHPLTTAFELVLVATDTPEAGVLAGGRCIDYGMECISDVQHAYSTAMEYTQDITCFGQMYLGSWH